MSSSFLNWEQSSAHFMMSGKLLEKIDLLNEHVTWEDNYEPAKRKIFPKILS